MIPIKDLFIAKIKSDVKRLKHFFSKGKWKNSSNMEIAPRNCFI
jgi:hypothetical protein